MVYKLCLNMAVKYLSSKQNNTAESFNKVNLSNRSLH